MMTNGVNWCKIPDFPMFPPFPRVQTAVEVHAKRHPSVSQGEGFDGAMSPEYERLGRLRAELARQGW